MAPFLLRVSTSKHVTASYQETRDCWSLRELVDHIYFIEGCEAMEEYHAKQQEKQAQKATRRIRR
jgi:hypothetical protein